MKNLKDINAELIIENLNLKSLLKESQSLYEEKEKTNSVLRSHIEDLKSIIGYIPSGSIRNRSSHLRIV